MKFGRNYHTHQVVEWADAYMNYATFKRLCKEPTASDNLPEIVARCVDGLDTVDQFYCKIYSSLLSKLSLKSRLGYPNLDILKGPFDYGDVDYSDLQYQKATFAHLVAEFDKLRWYGQVNTDCFQHIIRRIRSLGTHGIYHAAQVQSALCRSEFATQAQCLSVMENLQKIVAVITQAQHAFPPNDLSEVEKSFCFRLPQVNPSIPALVFMYSVEKDDPLEFEKLIVETCEGDLEFSRSDFLYALFQCSFRTSHHSWVDVLISHAISLGTVAVIENCVRYVIDRLCWSSSITQKANASDYNISLSLLTYMLDYLLARNVEILYKVDDLGRIPLHYACECDQPEVCRVILRSMTAWEQLGAGHVKSAIFLKDVQLRSPMLLSVLSGHLDVSKTLIFEGLKNIGDLGAPNPSLNAAFSELLLFVIKSDVTEAAGYFLTFDIDVNFSDSLGQTPIYLAARSGNETLMSLLLRHKPIVDKPEISKNWTPLIIASLAGFTPIAEILLEHGANIEHRDHAGWTAIDHASYRGHIPLAKALSKAAADLSYRQATELQDQPKSSSERKLSARGQPRRSFSATESHVIVNLGSLDSSNAPPPVCLSPHLTEHSFIINPQSLFSLRVSMLGTTNPAYTTSLPLLEDATNKPWIFSTVEPTEAKIVFEVLRNRAAHAGGHELVGRGIAFLDSLKRSEATKRESLNRDSTVPILSTVSLEYLGAVNFSFLISTPLVLPNTPTIKTEALWSEEGPSKVVGHRGMGQNSLPATRLQIGENTMQSYLSAVQCGASYVELDVQMTKDHTPVIYHDFLVSETGIDSPMHTITNEQFMHINNEQSPDVCDAKAELVKTPLNRRVRAFSMNASNSVQTTPLTARIKHTFDYQSRGCKGNTRGDFIHASYVSLEQLLRSLPLDIALDIEIKYPMLSEATIDWKMDPFFIEANFFTDTILLCLSKYISNRAVLLSSFSPEICILLACKQSRWPVTFLTDSGNWQSTDVRAANLQEAVSFAKRWQLDGIVLASEPFVLAPQLVKFVKGKGMVSATYGELNDDVAAVTIQAMSGVDIIIVNNVRLISEALAELQKT